MIDPKFKRLKRFDDIVKMLIADRDVKADKWDNGENGSGMEYCLALISDQELLIQIAMKIQITFFIDTKDGDVHRHVIGVYERME